MAKNGQELLEGLSRFLYDWQPSTTTSSGLPAGTTLVDTSLRRFQDGRLKGRYVRVTGSGANQYQVQTINTNAQSTGTVELTGSFPSQVASGTAYEIHRYDPAMKFRALDAARLDASDYVFKLVYNELITGDGRTDAFRIPSDMSMGPVLAWEETPVACQNILWNFLNASVGESTNYWTATNCIATVQSIDYTDLLIPKYDYAATKITVDSGAATYVQTVDNMVSPFTAAKAAGRHMTFAMWVYSLEANRVRLLLTDDSGTVYSDYHAGQGWQLLTVEADIVGNNSTVLTAGLDIVAGSDALTLYWNRSWLYFGNKERVSENYDNEVFIRVRRDERTQEFSLSRPIQRGRQLRIIGQEPLSELGSNPVNQVSNEMEVTDETAEILYARAASILLEWESLTASDVPEIYQRMQTVLGRMPRVNKFMQRVPSKHLNSPYWV